MTSELLKATTNRQGIYLDPRTKLLLLVTLSSLTLSTGNSNIMLYLKPFLAFLPFLILFLSKKYILGFTFIISFIVCFVLEIYMIVFGNSTLAFIVMCVSTIVTRFAPCVISAFYLMSTTSVSEFMGAMKKMHVTDKITIPLSVIFRFFPTVREDARSINTAMKMRGITVKKPMQMFEYKVVPLMISTIKASEELSCSALTRGLGSPKKRTNMCDIGFRIWDYIFIIFCIGSIFMFFFGDKILGLV